MLLRKFACADSTPFGFVSIHDHAVVVIGPAGARSLASQRYALHSGHGSQPLLQRDKERDSPVRCVRLLRMHAEDQQALRLLTQRSL